MGSGDKHMTTKIETVREIVTEETEFCACCGKRIEANTTVTLIRKAINARGRYAHGSCITKYNARIDAAIAKEAREAELGGMIPIVRAEELLRKH
jgi:hypothetical protein